MPAGLSSPVTSTAEHPDHRARRLLRVAAQEPEEGLPPAQLAVELVKRAARYCIPSRCCFFACVCCVKISGTTDLYTRVLSRSDSSTDTILLGTEEKRAKVLETILLLLEAEQQCIAACECEDPKLDHEASHILTQKVLSCVSLYAARIPNPYIDEVNLHVIARI